MNATLMTTSLLMLTNSAIGAPAQEYKCDGTDTFYNVPVEFKIFFADWAKNGYSNESLEMLRYDDKPISDRMSLKEEATQHCPRRQFYNSYELKPSKTSEGIFAFEFMRGCDAEVEYMISAECKKIY